MSLETVLAENTAALIAHGELLKQIDQNQQRLLAGQQTAIDKVEPVKATRARKTKDETPATTTDTKTGEDAAVVEEKTGTTTTAAAPVTAEQLKTFAQGWMVEDGKDSATYKERGPFLMDIQKHLGAEKLFQMTDADDLKKAMFFVRRKKAGLDVNFDVEYDFDGDPEQAEAAGDDFSDFG